MFLRRRGEHFVLEERQSEQAYLVHNGGQLTMLQGGIQETLDEVQLSSIDEFAVRVTEHNALRISQDINNNY